LKGGTSPARDNGLAGYSPEICRNLSYRRAITFAPVCLRPTSGFLIRAIRKEQVSFFRKGTNYSPGDRARTGSRERTERWCLCYPGSGTAMQLSPLFRSPSRFRHFWDALALLRPADLTTPSTPSPSACPLFPWHTQSHLHFTCDSPFSLALRFSLQMSPRGRLTFALSLSFFLPHFFRSLFPGSICPPAPPPFPSTLFSRLFDWRELLTTGWPLTTLAPSRCRVYSSCYSFSASLWLPRCGRCEL